MVASLNFGTASGAHYTPAYTAGPWHVMGRFVAVRTGGQAQVVAAWSPPPNGDAVLKWAVDGPASLQAVANAQLIAAAPRMFEALRMIEEIAAWSATQPLGERRLIDVRNSIATVARDAIAAATPTTEPRRT